MKRLFAALLAVAACVPPPAPTWNPTIVPPQPASTPTPTASTTYVTVPCPSTPPPALPKVTWLPEGCPPKYGACLSGEDAGAVSAYLEATRRWMAEARKCHGR